MDVVQRLCTVGLYCNTFCTWFDHTVCLHSQMAARGGLRAPLRSIMARARLTPPPTKAPQREFSATCQLHRGVSFRLAKHCPHPPTGWGDQQGLESCELGYQAAPLPRCLFLLGHCGSAARLPATHARPVWSHGKMCGGRGGEHACVRRCRSDA